MHYNYLGCLLYSVFKNGLLSHKTAETALALSTRFHPSHLPIHPSTHPIHPQHLMAMLTGVATPLATVALARPGVQLL